MSLAWALIFSSSRPVWESATLMVRSWALATRLPSGDLALICGFWAGAAAPSRARKTRASVARSRELSIAGSSEGAVSAHRDKLHGVGDHVAVAAVVADLDPAGLAGLEIEDAQAEARLAAGRL